nr:hypothetical protein [Tanacetum cinerariifolium]
MSSKGAEEDYLESPGQHRKRKRQLTVKLQRQEFSLFKFEEDKTFNCHSTTLLFRKPVEVSQTLEYKGGQLNDALVLKDFQDSPDDEVDTKSSQYVREFKTRVRQDTDEIYMRLDDVQTERQLLAGRLNMLFRDRRAHAYTRQLMETEARMSREAWARATDASDLVHGEVMSLRTTVLGQMSEISELQAADRRRQTVILELLRIDHRRSTEISGLRTALQGHVIALQG